MTTKGKTAGPWKLRNSGASGSWWILNVGGGAIISVGAEKCSMISPSPYPYHDIPDRGKMPDPFKKPKEYDIWCEKQTAYEWRIKICGDVIRRDYAYTLDEAKKVATAWLHAWAATIAQRLQASTYSLQLDLTDFFAEKA